MRRKHFNNQCIFPVFLDSQLCLCDVIGLIGIGVVGSFFLWISAIEAIERSAHSLNCAQFNGYIMCMRYIPQRPMVDGPLLNAIYKNKYTCSTQRTTYEAIIIKDRE